MMKLKDQLLERHKLPKTTIDGFEQVQSLSNDLLIPSKKCKCHQ